MSPARGWPRAAPWLAFLAAPWLALLVAAPCLAFLACSGAPGPDPALAAPAHAGSGPGSGSGQATGAGAAGADASPRPDPRAVEAAAPRTFRTAPLPALQDPSLPPAILLPSNPADDAEIAHAGALALKKSHVYDRFLDSDPTRTRKLIDLLVIDALIAHEAQRHGITVDPSRIEKLANTEQQQLEAQVKKDLGTKMTFAEYLERQLSMTVEEYRRWLVLNLARKVYREYVARYSAMLEDRVQVRYLVSSDKKIVDDALRRVRAGADFHSLALKHSEDETRAEGGLLPPFARGFQHPVALVALQLEPGQVSEPLPVERGGAVRWYLVYCLAKLARREVTFPQVREEIEREIDARPMTPFEFDAFYLQLRTRVEKLPSTQPRR